MVKYNINSEWNLWYHSITDDNWKQDFIKKLLQLKIYLITIFVKPTMKDNIYKMVCSL